MELGIWLVIAIVVALILLRIFFKLAKWVVIVVILAVLGIWLWNNFVATGA